MYHIPHTDMQGCQSNCDHNGEGGGGGGGHHHYRGGTLVIIITGVVP